MPKLTEAKKKSNAAWDAKNMATIGCKLKKEQAEAFREYCTERGTTPNAELRKYVLDCIGDTGAERDKSDE